MLGFWHRPSQRDRRSMRMCILRPRVINLRCLWSLKGWQLDTGPVKPWPILLLQSLFTTCAISKRKCSYATGKGATEFQL